MLQYIFSLLLLLGVWFVYTCIIQPKRRYSQYVKLFQAKGYKVYKMPYKLLGSPMEQKCLIDQYQKNDGLFMYKQIHPHFDVIISNSLNYVYIDLVHLDLIKEFFSVENLYNFPKAQAFTGALSFQNTSSKGVLLSEGAEWKKKRQVLNQVFTFDFLKSLTGNICEICDHSILTFEKNGKIENSDTGTQIFTNQFPQLAGSIFSNGVMEGFMGVGVRGVEIEGVPAYNFITKLMNDVTLQQLEKIAIIFGSGYLELGLWSSHRDVMRRYKIFETWGKQLINKKIEETKQKISTKSMENEKPTDIIEAILIGNEKKDQPKYTLQDIFEEFTTFFVAGTDTSSSLLTSMVYQISLHPEIEKKVRDEIERVMENEDYRFENLKKLTYIDCIQKQTMRMFSPSPGIFIREAIKDTYLCGIPIRKGTLISPGQTGNHFSEKHFKDPLVFRPQRWETQCDELHPLVMGGFSSGARSCIGKNLSFLQSKIALVKILKRYSKITLEKNNYKMKIALTYFPEVIKAKFEKAK